MLGGGPGVDLGECRDHWRHQTGGSDHDHVIGGECGVGVARPAGCDLHIRNWIMAPQLRAFQRWRASIPEVAQEKVAGSRTSLEQCVDAEREKDLPESVFDSQVQRHQ